MAKRLSILHPAGAMTLKVNPFGKDVANIELFRALARHGGFEQLDVLSQRVGDEAELRAGIFEDQPSATRIAAGAMFNTALPAQSGALLRGHPDLYELAWVRRRTVGDRAYSLLGLIHTIAPLAIRQLIAMNAVAPIQPWDAVICTSPSVRDAMVRMFAEWGDHLAERTAGTSPPMPALPIVPLGVDGPRLAALADRPDVRARRRAAMGLEEGDALVLWVGRLSFFEKAFPQPMFRAVQQAAQATGAKVQFAMAGWFPTEADRGRYEAAARAYAPDVTVSFPDGNDAALVGELWAAADVFLSLVDNIQETFGITPLEAMAAGLPVVASDWDGYRFTMRDGVEAFLIPTLGGPPGGLGATISVRHAFEIDSYQAYAGSVAQFTAVHVGRAAQALATLIASPERRRAMGQAGRARVAEAFDWPVVVGQYHALLDELAQIRAGASDPRPRHRINPVKGDPFVDFAGFATRAISHDLPLTAPPGVGPLDVLKTREIDLDQAFGYWRASLEECAEALRLVASGEARTMGDVLAAFAPDRRWPVALGVMWLAKQGLLDWPV
ncbi:MAG: glycosyl transferase, group 1 family protein [Phenylobacterium sp.]|nr:glycosyl transferase, group 1 family protein [Phenylobacterium sp.]